MASLKFKEACCLAFSGLLFFSGLILIGVASYLLFKIFYHYTFIPSGSVGPFFVIFLLGIAHLLVTWLGIKGPSREHNFHIILFIILILILLACEFAVGVWSIILWDEIEVGSIDLMTQSFDELITMNYYKKDWNKLQTQLHCCGINGLGDYNKTDAYPASCFIISQNSSQGTTYKEGCKLPLIKYVKTILINGAIIGFLCVIFQKSPKRKSRKNGSANSDATGNGYRKCRQYDSKQYSSCFFCPTISKRIDSG
ncbi:leukocyte surface antigen CD53-like isoform X2 [Anthonomus grandis grandis]|uniref:leukocyte surface antigen CD53-like isoform X2 n=1 Tax=Anthonomus grandis grandis TaxID=2921223 RepID=UPI0021653837|nr:leukocyte surface antigen CD53-like isoform X2 [Anthonomus grandis grandis]